MNGIPAWSLAAEQPGYPACLRDLGELPPPTLFGAGLQTAIERFDHDCAVTIVGSRSASSYGLRVAESLGRELALAEVTVVSGMARGIDGAAHRGALAGGGTTIAVLANGPEIAYPASHARLHSELVRASAVVSEHPPGTLPRKRFFTQRNRVMAALGKVVVIVEAAERSGTLVTASLASGLGRTVAAVPGQLGVRNAAGTNALIKDGAHLITGTRDVLDLLFGVGAGHPEPPVALEPELQAVLDLVGDGLTTVDRLALESGLAPGRVAVALARLELRGRVECDPVQGYRPSPGNPF